MMLSIMGVVRRSIPGRCLRWLVGTTDAALRSLCGITEFETASDGLLRIELGHAHHPIVLSDGTHIAPGDVVMELHLWNEQLMPLEGADFGWAVRMRRQTLSSLHRLALHIAANHELDAVRALCMRPAIARQRPTSALARLLLKIGFEPIASAPTGPQLVIRFLDNVWLWLLTWAHNPRTLDDRQFDRKRREFWISRARFLALFGDASALPASFGRYDRSKGGVAALKSAEMGGYRAPE